MERGSCLPRSKSSSRNSSPASLKNEIMLPLPVQASQRFPVRALLGHCFYRRIIIWAITVIIFLCLVLFSGGVHTRHGMIIDHFPEFGKKGHSTISSSTSSSGDRQYEDSSVGDNGIDTIDSSTTSNEIGSDIGEHEKVEQHKTIEQHPTHETQPADPNGPHWLKYQQ